MLCPELSAPENGDIGYDTIQHYYTSRAIYSCNSGYMLEGSDTRMCQRNGEWSGTPPTCKCKTYIVTAKVFDTMYTQCGYSHAVV